MAFLAIRHLLARKGQTLLILLGILIGTMGYVVISGMILGVQDFLIQSIIENDAHVRISAREEPISPEEVRTSLFREGENVRWQQPPSGTRGSTHIEYAQGWFDRLERDPEVAAYTPNLTITAIFRRGGTSKSGRLIGTDAERQVRITSIQDSMVTGDFTDLGRTGDRIILGEGLLEKIGSRPGETVLISVGQGRPHPFKIVGVVRFGIPELDDNTAYAALADVQKINGTPSRISDIAVRLVDENRAEELAARWGRGSRENIKTWHEINEQILSAFKVQDAMRYIVTASILVVAGFGIYNVLSIVIANKKREIAILRSVGFDSGDVLRLFLYQGWILGGVAGGAGLALGALVCLYLASVQIYPENIADHGYLPFSFAPSIYLTGFGLALFSALVASILPARRASRMTPMDIIRAEQQ